MSDEEESQLTDEEKIEIAKWFLLNSPVGEIQYVAKDVRGVLKDDRVYRIAAAEGFPLYNKSHVICLEFSDRSGEVLVTSYNEIDKNEYFVPQTAQVAIVDHVKQVCTDSRPANDDELPSSYIEEYRNGSWQSLWYLEFKDDIQLVEVRGKLQVGAHYLKREMSN